jgi:hypothetical protein
LDGENMQKPQYIKWLIEEKGVTFEDGMSLNCYKLDYLFDDEVFNDWALHIRKHYIFDDVLNESIHSLKITPEEYLRKYVIPQKDDELGSISRSSDITEIIISDLFEFILDYIVPRWKQQERTGKTLSEHGTDIIAYKYYRSDKRPSTSDELLAIEVKAQLTSDNTNVIVSSTKDSRKDEQRHAHTLDVCRKKLKRLNQTEQAQDIARFQLKSEHDYKITYIGAGISSKAAIENNILVGTCGADLKLMSNQKVFYIHGEKLMQLTHEVYERCVK